MGDIFALQIPYLYVIHVMIVAVRVGAMFIFAPIWGSPALPRQVRMLLVFVTAAGVSSVVPLQ